MGTAREYQCESDIIVVYVYICLVKHCLLPVHQEVSFESLVKVKKMNES